MKQLTGPAIRFLLVGSVTTSLLYLLLVLCVELLHMRADLSSGLAYALASVLAYFLNRNWSFRSDAPHARASFRYFVIQMGGLTLNTLCMTLLTAHLGFHYIPSQVVATGVSLVWNFFGQALWSFRSPPAQRRA